MTPLPFMFQMERNFLRHAIEWKFDSYKPYKPLCAYVYFTFRCNLSCVYCNDGSGLKYPQCSNQGELDTESWLKVLSILRRETDVLIITGGEPTMRPDLPRLLEGCRNLSYRKVCLLTNGLTLDRHPEIFKNCQILMISLDTLNEAKADLMMGGKQGVFRRIISNIELAAKMRQDYDFKLYFNVVITPDNIADVHDVIDYCLKNRIGFTPLPEVVAVYPREGLRGNVKYEELIERIKNLKKAGGDILGTMGGYLSGLKHLDKYHCLPTLLARVWPNGDLLYPCQKMHKVGGNLLELGDYTKAVDEGRRRHGPLPSCDNRCHVGCYMDFSQCVQRPSILLGEAWHSLKKPFFKPEKFIC
ncbi:MAG: radical SAM protein [Elusimicrobia bacterium]|nr:radical SAM protein [Elusimicrobiota bacterium]